MDVGGKRWPTQRCAGPALDNTIINRIMLRFRPIAPKPVTDGSVGGSFQGENKAELVTKPRAKRKYVRVKKNRKCKINKEQEKKDLNFEDGGGGGGGGGGAAGAVVTLRQMQEEMGGMKLFPGIRTSSSSSRSLMSFSLREESSRMISVDVDKSESNDVFRVDNESDRGSAVMVRSTAKVVESLLVVEGMSETWLDVGILGSTDRERMQNLELDTCPGLISDSLHRVQWVNLAYRKMVNGEEDDSSSNNNNNSSNSNSIISSSIGGEGEEGGGEVVVWLVVKEKIPVVWPVFACTVRVVYTCRQEKQYSQTMPCDVWKMDFGGYAWRLDSKAALSLGRR